MPANWRNDWLSHVTRHTSHITLRTSHVTRHTSHVARHTSHSHVTRHTSHVTRHKLHVTRCTSHVTCDCMRGPNHIPALPPIHKTRPPPTHPPQQELTIRALPQTMRRHNQEASVSDIIRHMSHVTRHTPQVAQHMSNVKCHEAYVPLHRSPACAETAHPLQKSLRPQSCGCSK